MNCQACMAKSEAVHVKASSFAFGPISTGRLKLFGRSWIVVRSSSCLNLKGCQRWLITLHILDIYSIIVGPLIDYWYMAITYHFHLLALLSKTPAWFTISPSGDRSL